MSFSISALSHVEHCIPQLLVLVQEEHGILPYTLAAIQIWSRWVNAGALSSQSIFLACFFWLVGLVLTLRNTKYLVNNFQSYKI